MNCPACGAAMHLAGNRGHFVCDYCGGCHFPEETADGVGLIGDATPWNCPVCATALETAVIEGESVAYCGSCRGFLTAHAAFGRIVTQRRSKQPEREPSCKPFDPSELRRSIKCPQCARKMETCPFSGGGNAVIDTCTPCNLIWLDADELTVIGSYVPHVPRRECLAVTSGEPDPAPDLLDLW